MPEKRPAVPRALARRLLIEAGHRCAIPTCRAHPVELAHISPWSRVRSHAFDNMIALCPNCHTRFDRGDIDQLAMRHYKAALSAPATGTDDQHGAITLQRVQLLDAYRLFHSRIDTWGRSIKSLQRAILYSSSGGSVFGGMDSCEREAGRAREALGALNDAAARPVGNDDIRTCAEWIFEWFVGWAKATFRFELPVSAEEWQEEVDMLLETRMELHESICHALGRTPEEVPLGPAPHDDSEPMKLGRL